MRIQKRPQYRATAAVMFNSWENGYDAVRQIAQSKLWPSNLRILDPDLTADSTGIDNGMSLLIIGFESSDLSQKRVLDQAIEIAKLCNGIITNDNIIIDDGTGAPTGRGGAVGAWRNAFINVGGGLTAGLGMVTGTFETAITWDKWPGFDKKVREATQAALDDVCGGGTLNCRFTHVYPDGPAPYYTYVGNYKKDGYFEQQNAIKKAASDAIISAGGTITHHHAVGRLHKPWYDLERPELFAESLKAMKKVCDPSGILNPGVLIDPA
jgi:alkyldihydroxyacetonephosphate synthase